MELKELAAQIAQSDNPYAEFDKHASEMDEVHTSTLSRELNRQLFLKGLSGSALNSDVEFGLIDSGEKEGAAVGNEEADASIKVASIVDKSEAVDESMFILHHDKNKMIKMAAHGSLADEHYDVVAKEDYEKVASIQKAEREQSIKDDSLKLYRELDGLDYIIIDDIVKTASHEGELRSSLAVLASNGRADLIEPTILSSNYSVTDIENTDSEPLSAERVELLKTASVMTTEIAEDTKACTRESVTQGFEKVAILGSLMKNVGGAALKAVGGSAVIGAKGTVGAGKMLWKHKKKSAAGLLGGLSLASGAEVNREKIVDGLM